jgi:hypothetical protein
MRGSIRSWPANHSMGQSMRRDQVKNERDALAYIVDCTLATVESLALKRNPPVRELDRQIAIAQHAIDWMVAFNVPHQSTRAEEITTAKKSVRTWAFDMRQRILGVGA